MVREALRPVKGTLLAAFLLGSPPARAEPAAPSDLPAVSVESGGHRRRAWVFAPKTGRERRPAVLALCGSQGVEELRAITGRGLEEAAARDGWVVAYPEPYHHQWNDGRDVPSYPVVKEGIDDGAFLAALIDHLAATRRVDRRRVFVAGYSVGGMMAQRFACERPERVAAAASVAGTLPANVARRCKAKAPVPMLLILGDKDPFQRYKDGYLKVGPFRRGHIVGPEAALGFWAKADGCGARPEMSALPDRDKGDGSTVRLTRYPGCRGGAEVRLYEVEGGGHAWPGGRAPEGLFTGGVVNRDFDATRALWEFFLLESGPSR